MKRKTERRDLVADEMDAASPELKVRSAMRSRWLLVVVLVFVGLSVPSAMANETADRPWSVGYAEADITPALGQSR